MKQLMASLKSQDARKRLPVVLMEIDYELVNLSDAIKAKDKTKIQETKRKLELYRREWLMLRHETASRN
ncbi:hypothetical protein [Aureibacillus halotolerans]|uniref:Uncharacterized protein n=1 Tax=Aureibacillus halotolerans TaxID=1508390 RepID=A0A4R6UBD0_9BACI|nr:hypothetical protein [Aureibacillus halotolerans]TDQ42269.1 hypothetical protein EV213_102300 [Aureibacillus halotolerans]